MKTTKNDELYVKTIYLLNNGQYSVGIKSIWIAEQLNVSKPAVVQELRCLKSKNLVRQQDYGKVRLTRAGFALVKKLKRKNNVIHRLYKYIGCTKEAADHDAKEMEHLLDDIALKKLEHFLDNLENVA